MKINSAPPAAAQNAQNFRVILNKNFSYCLRHLKFGFLIHPSSATDHLADKSAIRILIPHKQYILNLYLSIPYIVHFLTARPSSGGDYSICDTTARELNW